jgi:cobalamin biosynthesis Mg chelatase CobN
MAEQEKKSSFISLKKEDSTKEEVSEPSEQEDDVSNTQTRSEQGIQEEKGEEQQLEEQRPKEEPSTQDDSQTQKTRRKEKPSKKPVSKNPRAVVGKSKKPQKTKDTILNQPRNTTMKPIGIPGSLILAGNLLVIFIIAFFYSDPALWQYILVFASVEVLLGATLWHMHGE